MAFQPTLTLLGTVNEYVNILFTVTYVSTPIFGGIGIPQPVTIVANQENPTIIVEENTIRGYYSDSFDNFVRYRTKQDTFVEVNKFRDVNTNELYGIYHYDADKRLQIPYTYTASIPSGESQTYTIIVSSNYTPGRNELLKYVNIEFYETYIKVLFINNNNENVSWVNSSNEIVDWENNTWPNL